MSNHTAATKYAAKIDWWIGASIVIGIATPFVVAVASSIPWMYAAGIVALILVFGFCYPQSYETTPGALVIRAGLSKRTIPYPQIIAVRPSSESGSALALSLGRIRVECVSGCLLIAPKEKSAFFADLAAQSPQLNRQGHDLVVSLG